MPAADVAVVAVRGYATRRPQSHPNRLCHAHLELSWRRSRRGLGRRRGIARR
ncbi:MAG: hypothetical protein ACK55I_31865 [bacterium]